jgi:uncharacterized RDD family membrane protein YckC
MNNRTHYDTQRWEVDDAKREAALQEIRQKYRKEAKPSFEFAGFWRRMAAYVIDGIILSLLNYVIDRFENNSVWGSLTLSAIGLLIWTGYFIWAYSFSGQTIGKRILGIRVAAIDGSSLNWRKGFLRFLGYIPSTIGLLLGFLWSIWDADKQAWHDKIAGTCVVRAWVTPQQLWDRIDPLEIKRRQRRWLLGLGIPSVLMCLGGAVWYSSFIQRSMAEVASMGPWPAGEVSARQVVAVDLSYLGPKMGEIQSAREEEMWARGQYEEGVLVTYNSGENVVVRIWGLRYEEEEAASNDFDLAEVWARQNCAVSSWGQLGEAGVIHCGWSNGYCKIFRKDNWIVEILALKGTRIKPEALVNAIRDALAAHWARIAGLRFKSASISLKLRPSPRMLDIRYGTKTPAFSLGGFDSHA